MNFEQLEHRKLLTRMVIEPVIQSDMFGQVIPGHISQVQSIGDYSGDGIDDLMMVYSDLTTQNMVFVYDVVNEAYVASENADFGPGTGSNTKSIFGTNGGVGVETSFTTFQILPEFVTNSDVEPWYDDLVDFNGDGIRDRIRNRVDDVEIIFGANSDINDDGQVDFADFLVLSSNFGMLDASRSDGDISGNGRIDFVDFLFLSRDFGKSL